MLQLLLCFLMIVVFSAHATSRGYSKYATLKASIDGRPALCLPSNMHGRIPLGWISVSESYTKNPGTWAVEKLPGAAPVYIAAGDCVVYGDVPAGYRLTVFSNPLPNLTLKVGHTYVFRVSDANNSVDNFYLVFCVYEKDDGSISYYSYARKADGAYAVPRCDAKRNGDMPI